MVPSPQARPSTTNATDTDMSPDYGNLDRSSGAVLPTLDKVTFRPHSPHCYGGGERRFWWMRRGAGRRGVIRFIDPIGRSEGVRLADE
jgi:hypothetical protein